MSANVKAKALRGAKIRARILRTLVYLGAAFSMCVLLLIVGYILIKGVPNLNLDLFAWTYNTENVSLMPALVNTLFMTALSLLIAVPLGIGAAIYLTEYARRGNRLVKLVRITWRRRSRASPRSSTACSARCSSSWR